MSVTKIKMESTVLCPTRWKPTSSQPTVRPPECVALGERHHDDRRWHLYKKRHNRYNPSNGTVKTTCLWEHSFITNNGRDGTTGVSHTRSSTAREAADSPCPPANGACGKLEETAHWLRSPACTPISSQQVSVGRCARIQDQTQEFSRTQPLFLLCSVDTDGSLNLGVYFAVVTQI